MIVSNGNARNKSRLNSSDQIVHMKLVTMTGQDNKQMNNNVWYQSPQAYKQIWTYLRYSDNLQQKRF